jgi:hypothetical protein
MTPSADSPSRDHAFMPVACDIPDGMTIREYRARRRQRSARAPRLLRRLRRR